MMCVLPTRERAVVTVIDSYDRREMIGDDFAFGFRLLLQLLSSSPILLSFPFSGTTSQYPCVVAAAVISTVIGTEVSIGIGM